MSTRIVIKPKYFSFYFLFESFLLCVFVLMIFASLYSLQERLYVDIDDYIPLLSIMMALGLITLVGQPIGRKIVINENKVTYFTYFFFKKSIVVSEKTKISTGVLKYSTIKHEWGWKISNRHGKERIWISGFWCDTKKVNAEFSRLVGKEIPMLNQTIVF